MKKSDVKEVSRKSLRFSTALQGAACRGAGVEPTCQKARHVCLASPRGPTGVSPPPLRL